jgi:hypothetical protein
MRFRTGLLIGGVIGYLVARKLAERDPDEARPAGLRQAMARHPSTTRGSGAERFLERAAWRSAEAIRRARAGLQRRIEPDLDDLSMN